MIILSEMLITAWLLHYKEQSKEETNGGQSNEETNGSTVWKEGKDNANHAAA